MQRSRSVGAVRRPTGPQRVPVVKAQAAPRFDRLVCGLNLPFVAVMRVGSISAAAGQSPAAYISRDRRRSRLRHSADCALGSR